MCLLSLEKDNLCLAANIFCSQFWKPNKSWFKENLEKAAKSTGQNPLEAFKAKF